MSFLLSGVLAGALVLDSSGAISNGLQRVELAFPQTNASVEKEYERVLADEAAARSEVDRWRQENKGLTAKGIGMTQGEVERRTRERFESIDKAYSDFLRRHPSHAGARLSYGCFLNDRQDEAGAQAQWEKALELEPKNADAYNNLAGRYCEIGPAKKAFEFYSHAIELKPSEAIYYHNFADAIYVLRSHAMTHYGLSEQQVFSKALALYSNAWRLEPQNLAFASDWAQTYYAVKPLPYAVALQAWTNALRSANNESEREDVYLHLARVKMLAGWLGAARAQLQVVTNESCAGLKAALLRAIEERQKTEPSSDVRR